MSAGMDPDQRKLMADMADVERRIASVAKEDSARVAAAKAAPNLTAPSYYTRGGIEAFDVIRAWSLDYFRGNVLKYIARAGHKDPAREVEDLEKARVYLDEAIRMAKERAK